MRDATPASGDPLIPVAPSRYQSRLDRLRQVLPRFKLEDGDVAYLETFDLAEAYPQHLEEMRRAIQDFEADR